MNGHDVLGLLKCGSTLQLSDELRLLVDFVLLLAELHFVLALEFLVLFGIPLLFRETYVSSVVLLFDVGLVFLQFGDPLVRLVQL